VDRRLTILVAAGLATLLVAGAAQAAKPMPTTPAGQAYFADTGLNTVIPIPSVGTPSLLLNELVLPSDGRFVISATLQVYNSSTTVDAEVGCFLFYGTGNTTGTRLDSADVLLQPGTISAGAGAAKLALSGIVERTSAPAGLTVRVICAVTGTATAEYGHLSAISVSSIDHQ